jgi:flagellar motor switch protein FliG
MSPGTGITSPGWSALTGAERAAALLLVVGLDAGRAILAALEEDELARVTQAVARLGRLDSGMLAGLVEDLERALGQDAGIGGGPEAARALIAGALPEERAAAHLERLGGAPADIWTRLARRGTDRLAAALGAEHPQAAALALSRLPRETSAAVLAALPEEVAAGLLDRLIGLGTPAPGALARLGQVLDAATARPGRTEEPDPAGRAAEIVDGLERRAGERLLARVAPETAERLRERMFTFEDIATLDPKTAQTVMRVIARDRLALALKGAPGPVRDFFLAGMSSRAAKGLAEDMETLGAVRLADVEAARADILRQIRLIADNGEIRLRGGADEPAEEMVA